MILSARLVLEKNRASRREAAFPQRDLSAEMQPIKQVQERFCGISDVDGLFCHVEKQGAVKTA